MPIPKIGRRGEAVPEIFWRVIVILVPIANCGVIHPNFGMLSPNLDVAIPNLGVLIPNLVC